MFGVILVMRSVGLLRLFFFSSYSCGSSMAVNCRANRFVLLRFEMKTSEFNGTDKKNGNKNGIFRSSMLLHYTSQCHRIRFSQIIVCICNRYEATVRSGIYFYINCGRIGIAIATTLSLDATVVTTMVIVSGSQVRSWLAWFRFITPLSRYPYASSY